MGTVDRWIDVVDDALPRWGDRQVPGRFRDGQAGVLRRRRHGPVDEVDGGPHCAAVGCFVQFGSAIVIPVIVDDIVSGQLMAPAGEPVGRASVAVAAAAEPSPVMPGIPFMPVVEPPLADAAGRAAAAGDWAAATSVGAAPVVEAAITFAPSSETNATGRAANATAFSRAGAGEPEGDSTTSAAAASMVVVTRAARSIVSDPLRM
jgi:hypothetical protein